MTDSEKLDLKCKVYSIIKVLCCLLIRLLYISTIIFSIDEMNKNIRSNIVKIYNGTNIKMQKK